ncbi:MAG: DUF3108 domain-containing protein [Hyphomicrobium sp.]|nr:DUF3108 domain-containing protein [Hyphomicrobium sp.]
MSCVPSLAATLAQLFRRPARTSLVAAATAAALAANPAAAGPEAGPELADLGASYAISFNGFEIGTMRLETHVGDTAYHASSDVEISALLGAFRWKGVTRVAGAVSEGKLRPDSYTFDFDSSARSGAVRMGFEKGTVTALASEPAMIDPPDFVPLAPAHVKSVLDPLSAVLALTRPEKGQPCGRKVAIFDGRQRLDIRLVARRTETIQLASGRTVTGTVCGVKYTPVGGYRDNTETRSMAENDGIEVAFRTLGATGVFAPYRVSLPTMAGWVSIDATRIDLTSPTGDAIALVQ